MSVGYVVELPVFQGPLDLLLHLIEKEELDITRVALAQVTDQYLAYLERMPQRDPAELSAFLVVAAKLLWIKSQALLPRSPVVDTEQEDDAEDLVRQLQEYKRYKEIARQFQQWVQQGRHAFGRFAPPPVPTPRPAEIEGATMQALLSALQLRLQEMADDETTQPLPVPRRVTLADKARQIHNLVKERGTVTFHDLLEQAPTREEVVVTLWTVLELFKRRWITVEQEELFGTITIHLATAAADDWDRSTGWWAELEELA